MRVIKIEISNKNIDKIIKNTRKIVKYCDKNNYKLKFIYNNEHITREINNNLFNIETAVNIKNIKERYSFIYDYICDYIDDKYLNCNYCDFKNDVCIYFRTNKDFSHKNGCCYSKKRGGLCEHFKNNSCQIKSISCKLYSCEVLRKNKVSFKINDFVLIKYFFNLKQKYFIKYSFFKPKKFVLNKLIEGKKYEK